MRKYLLLIFSLIIIVIIHRFAFADIKTEIVIKGQWGNKSNEFGIDRSAHCPTGPYSFCVDEYGNIYIIDNENSRFKKYNERGELVKIKSYKDIFWHVSDITINADGELFLLAENSSNSRLVIAELDSEFIAIRECILRDLFDKRVETYGGRMIIADDKDIYFDYLSNIYKISDFKVVEKLGGPLILSNSYLIKAERIGETDKRFPSDIQVLYELETKNVQISFAFPHQYYFNVTMDSRGRVYIRDYWCLGVYSCTGSFIDTISIMLGGCPGFEWKIGLDDNYYQMNCDLDGFCIYRYTVTED